MAGDIGIREQVVVLPPQSASGASVAGAISQTPGRVLHQFGERVLVIEAPPGADDPIRQVVPAGSLLAEAAGAGADLTQDLSETEALGLAAIQIRQSEEYAVAKANRPRQGENWDTSGADALGCGMPEEPEDSASADAEASAPTSTRLTGRVAVGVIIVQGPTNALKFSAAERAKVVAEVQNGLGWLGGQNPAGAISWKYKIHNLTISAQPGPSGATSGQKEALFRNPAMAQLGYGTGMSNVRKYVNDIRSQLNTNWGYCVFFTKYPVGHFAYASIGGPRIVMQYANDGWGPDNIDRVFAHETGHIFGAPDEYAGSGCNCGGSWGHYGKPNKNCANCAPGGGVKCLMKSNDWEMCAHTPYHLGFPLVKQRFSGVWRGGAGKYGLWVNASWGSFRSKWQAWSKNGLRLVDMKITPNGNSRRYHGCFVQGSGKYGLWVNSDWNGFKKKWQEWAKQGMRLVDIEIVKVGSATRYSGVWTAGTDKYALWVNSDWKTFRAKWQAWAKQGLRLVDLKITSFGGVRRYSGVWRGGNDKYGLWVNSDWNTFRAKWQQWAKQGLRLVDLEIITINGKRRYSGVWRGGNDKYGLWVNSDYQHFKQKWQDWAKSGMRLIDIEVTSPSGVAMSPDSGAQGVEIDENGGVGFGSEAQGEFEDFADDLDIGAMSEEQAVEMFAVSEGFGGISESDPDSEPDSEDGMGGIEGGDEASDADDGEGGIGGDDASTLDGDDDVDTGGVFA